jgi:hypothetical protein
MVGAIATAERRDFRVARRAQSAAAMPRSTSTSCAILCAIAVSLSVFACGSSPSPEAPSPEQSDSDPGTVVGSTRDVGSPSLAALADDEAIAFGDAAVLAPARGAGVGIALHGLDGTTTWLEVSRDDNGDAHVVDHGQQALGAGSASGSPPPCKDSAFHLEGPKWNKPYAWWFRASSTPTGTAAARAESTLRWAATTITSGRNDCGMPDRITATHVYKGRTTRGTNMVSTSTSVTCGTPDGFNVVAYGVLPRNYLGVTCYWYDGSGATEADVKLNDHYHRWFTGTSVPSGCNGTFSLASVAVHEFGHVFGLAHVAEATHANLTMSPVAGPCSMGPASLGRGDVLGLRAKYAP